MTKKEIIWRHILEQAITERLTKFTQKEIAAHFEISLSTVFNALKIPRKTHAIEVAGKFFRLRDFEKLLVIWATQRNFKKDIIYSTRVDLPVEKMEANQPHDIIFGAFSAYKFKYKDKPADYGAVYVYAKDIKEIKKRFPPTRGYHNLFVLNADDYLAKFGNATPDTQTFVDLWNIKEWYAKDFLHALKQKIL